MGSSSPRNNFYHQNWRGSGLYMYMYKTGGGLGYTCTCTKLARVWAIHVHVQNWRGSGLYMYMYKIWYTTWVWELAYKKTTFITKIGGGTRLGKHPKNGKTPYLFLLPLKLATSNLVHNSGLGSTLQ